MNWCDAVGERCKTFLDCDQCYSDTANLLLVKATMKEHHNGNGDSERAQTHKSLNCRNDETPSQILFQSRENQKEPTK
jgi:hypothetical protein